MPAPSRSSAPARRGNGTRAATAFYRGDDYLIDDSIGYLMRIALAGLKRDAEARLQAHGMTSEQALPLLAMSQGLCKNGADLARFYEMDPGAVTRMLDRIEAKGLVERVRSAEDRRVVELRLTRSGRSLAARIPAVLADTLNDALRGFTRDEVAHLKDMLRRIAASTRTAGTQQRGEVER